MLSSHPMLLNPTHRTIKFDLALREEKEREAVFLRLALGGVQGYYWLHTQGIQMISLQREKKNNINKFL